MLEKRVKISSIIANQLPEYVQAEFPLVLEFLKQYYISLESDGNPSDIVNNIDQYVRLDNITNLISNTTLTSDVGLLDNVISVESTAGFSNQFGLIKIGGEIITYEFKTDTTFENCYRGFSGVTSYNNQKNIDQLIFTESSAQRHSSGVVVENLNTLLLDSFFKKLKTQISPGFEDRDFFSELNESLFVKQSKDFYTSKGTAESFRILFKVLYGKDVKVILPRDFLFEPSDANYRIVNQLAVEVIDGNANDLINKTIYQNNTTISEAAEGVINTVEELIVNNPITQSYFLNPVSLKSAFSPIKNYYLLGLDFDYNKDIDTVGSTKGNFTIHPKTKLVSNIVTGQTYLDVDSTVGFPSSGTLIIDLPDGSVTIIQYNSKTINQFFECTGINQDINAGEEVKYDDYAYVLDTNSNQIKLRITGVISNLYLPDELNLVESGDTIKINHLGKVVTDDYRLNSWFFNIKSNFDVLSISLIDALNFVYEVETYDNHDFKLGDVIFMFGNDGTTSSNGIVNSIVNEKTITISEQGSLDLSKTYKIYRNLSKVRFKNYPELSVYNANVSNSYFDEVSGDVYVSAPSLPNYNNEELKLYNKKISGSITNNSVVFVQKHPYLSGELVVIKINNNSEQITGYIKKVNNNSIKLAKNKDSIITDTFIDLGEYESLNCVVEYLSFNDYNNDLQKYESKQLQTQKIIRKISIPKSFSTKETETQIGPIGIFVNGVEIYSYKSTESIYYGPIESVRVLAGGENYDIINPPKLTISDTVGTGATGHCFITGSLQRIDILDPGFNYIEQPTVTISGGNGINANAEVSLVTYTHFAEVNANTSTVNSTIDTITFSSPHKFSTYERVRYVTNGNRNISGITTNATYFVGAVGINTIKLYSSTQNVLNDIPLQINVSQNLGNHKFESVTKKRKIGSINILNPGSEYSNRKIIVSSANIDLSNNLINKKNHGYKTGELISYQPTGTTIGGLTTSTYYVGTINKDNFRLFEKSNLENQDFFLKTNQYILLTGVGSSEHIFNYPGINVSISGKFEVPTGNLSSDFVATIQPIFRGSIDGVFLTNTGSSYGSEEIIDYEKQPTFLVDSGSGALVSTVISNGRIISAFVVNSGENYNSPPTLVISGSGSGAVLNPVIEDGKLVDVYISSSGEGYISTNTFVSVVNAGQNAKFSANIKEWIINLGSREISNLDNETTFDDGYINPSRSNYGLQYSHIYGSRKLRENVITKIIQNNEIRLVSDLILENGVETTSQGHSPIVGWAYDGNPIYGPYSYRNADGTGGIKQITSGYSAISDADRPSGYDSGFFVNDFIFNESGDLDRHNGRFCVTPEFPNGIYAYFLTYTQSPNVSFGNYKLPVFPYVIGNTYKSKPIEFNFDIFSNDDAIELNDTLLIRNTFPYNVTKNRSRYDYFLNSNSLKIDSTVRSALSGNFSNIQIVEGGTSYKVNDQIIFDNKNTSGNSASAFVQAISGVNLSNISCASSSFVNVEFLNISKNRYIGYVNIPHNLIKFDDINIFFKNEKLQTSKINYDINSYTLNSGIATNSGICTYINVSANLNIQTVRENDLYRLNTEIVKVLMIDNENSRLKILRGQENTAGIVSHNSGSRLTEISKKIFVNLNIENNYDSKLNKELYFDPSESLGIGTTSGPGITRTLNFTNPGSGKSVLDIPTQTIYIKNHKLNTGDILTYYVNEGSSIEVSNNGLTSFALGNLSTVYAAKLSNDLIGISTNQIGLNSTGNYIGIGTQAANLLYFTGIGTNTYHSFKTNYSNILTGEVGKNEVTVSAASSHQLKLLDNIDVQLNLNNTIKTVIVKYNDTNSRFVVDPIAINSVNVQRNTLEIPNHNFADEDKIIYNTASPIGGLINDEIYYVKVLNSSEIQLAITKYGASNDQVVNLTSIGTGEISKINPNINTKEYQKIKFDLSDESLSYLSPGLTRLSSFTFNIFLDEFFSDNLFNTKNDFIEIAQTGIIGVSANANITITINKNTPKKLYYKLIPILSNENPQTKKDLIFDADQRDFNQINIVESGYNGIHEITNVTNNTFTYNLIKFPESSSYSSVDGILFYDTTSTNVSGKISKIKLTNKGNNYKTLPPISNIITDSGQFATLYPLTKTIGKLNEITLPNVGYNYSADLSLRPSITAPVIVQVNAFSIFKSIDVVDPGFSYNTNTNLIVVDGFTEEFVSDVNLEYVVDQKRVNIIQNTQGITNYQPFIIPVNNPNGLSVKNFEYNSINQTVTVTLIPEFSNAEDFVFDVGTKVLIEGVFITDEDSNAKSYNSGQFGYKLFEIVNSDPKLGGIGATVTYKVEGLLNSDEYFGTINNAISDPKIVPQSYFPTFNPILVRANFTIGETVSSNSATGIVESWDQNTGYLKIITNGDFVIGNSVSGQTSKTKGIIISSENFKGSYTVNASSIQTLGWTDRKGFISNTLQRLHDNNYYQYFSYSLKSEIDYNTWNVPVLSLNHTAGFKEFSDLEVIGIPANSGFATDQNFSDFSSIASIFNLVDVDCNYNFDSAKENSIVFQNQLSSNRLIFRSVQIKDYIESAGNRVLLIDDISSQFDSTSRNEPYSSVSIEPFNKNDFRYSKFFVTLANDINNDESMAEIVTVLHDDTSAYLNQYAKLYSSNDLGFFDVGVSTTSDFELRFYPFAFDTKNYNILNVTGFNIDEISSGISTQSLGNSVKLTSISTGISSGISTSITLCSLDTSTRTAKIITLISDVNNSEYESMELNVVHNGTNVYLNEFANLSSTSGVSVSGIGTYDVNISGPNLNVTFTPNVATSSSYVANSFVIELKNNTFTGVGTAFLSNSYLNSQLTTIASNPSPSPVSISTFSANDVSSSYMVISIEDTTNSRYKMAELFVHANEFDQHVDHVEYGITETSNISGIITTYNSAGVINVFFTPDANTNYRVNVFKSVFYKNTTNNILTINDSSYINNSYGFYQSSLTDLNSSFELYYKGDEIFTRSFESDNLDIINLDDDTINIPRHFFVTGEEIVYELNSLLQSNSSPIGIATTTISGIGTTDILPSTLYVVKEDNLNIRVSGSATDALLPIPKYLNLNTLGIGTHTFKSQKQNTKCLIAIDNIIQVPLVSLANTTKLANNFDIFETIVTVEDASTFKSGNYISITDEIFEVLVSGYNSQPNDLLVKRAILGTNRIDHFANELVQQLSGEYNITDNTLHFVAPPQGEIPDEVPTDPDQVDYSGIKTKSTFSGRVFLRSGVEDTAITPYGNNYLFDSVSDQFDGINNSFVLTAEDQNATGFSTNNVVALVRNVFQLPSSDVIVGDYFVEENTGITTLTFTGDSNPTPSDINNSSVPRGGVIISVGSTSGFGYQPLVSAGGTVVVSAGGTIQSISIGNSGSGYRFGLQTVNVGVKTEDVIDTNIEYIGTATISSGHITGVAITNSGIGYTYFEPIYNTQISSPVSVGSTRFFVSDLFDIDTTYFAFSGIGTGIKNVPIVGVATTSFFIGSGSTVSNSFGIGTTITFKKYKPPIVVFDSPLSYSNIPLIYSSQSSSGIGTEAVVDLVVSQDTTILNFELKNSGYAYKLGDILTVSIGGTTGIPTSSSTSFNEFQLTVTDVYFDEFAAWHLGQLQIIDDFDDLIDGVRSVFPIRISGEQTSIEPKPGSLIDIDAVLMIFIDDILQVPGESYIFTGGSLIEFTQPVSLGSKSKIIFYRGTDEVDTRLVDILETIKVGDTVRLISDNSELTQKFRIVQEIIASDILRTNLYSDIGVSPDENLYRNLIWCKQKTDLFITDTFTSAAIGRSTNSFIQSKARESYSSYINPSAYLIKDFSDTDTEIFVDISRTSFDNSTEYTTQPKEVREIRIISQDAIVSASATAIISSGQIASIDIIDGGIGYGVTPNIYVSSPIGGGTTAILTANLSGTSVTNINIVSPGSGYGNTNSPSILIEYPEVPFEIIQNASYQGDYGLIVGIGLTTIGASDGLILDLFIPQNSFMRNESVVGSAITVSQIQSNYYFTITNSNTGDSITSLDSTNTTIGIGSTFIDNVYQVNSVSIGQTNVPGIGVTTISKVLVKVSDNSTVSVGQSYCYGEFSWGRIFNISRKNPKNFTVYNNGISGIQTSPIVHRYIPLKN